MLQEKRCVVIAVDMMDESKSVFTSTNFYALDNLIMNSNENEAETSGGVDESAPFAPLVSAMNRCYKLTSFTSIGSRLYRVGGSYYSCAKMEEKIEEYNEATKYRSPTSKDFEIIANCYENSRLVEYCDMLKDPFKWKKGPNLNAPRGIATLMVLDETLYALRGLSLSVEDTCFMEFLDKESKTWVTLPNPPINSKQLCCVLCASVEELGGILLFVDGEPPCAFIFTHIYGWQPFVDIHIESTIFLKYGFYQAVVIGKVLLWMSMNGTSIFGVDLTACQTFEIDLVEEGLLPMRSIESDDPQLIHLEKDEVCLIWKDDEMCVYGGQGLDGNNVSNNYVDYHCLKFRIVVAPSYPDLRVISRGKWIAPAFPYMFRAAFAVNVVTPKRCQQTVQFPLSRPLLEIFPCVP